LLASEKLDVNVSAQPDVKGQVPVDVVRIVIDHHLVVVPLPAVAVAVFIRGNVSLSVRLLRAVLRNVMSTRLLPMFFTLALSVLRPNRNLQHQQNHQKITELLHAQLFVRFECPVFFYE
jgi:hypothetical protein